MPRITITNAVVKGHHVYNYATVIGRVYDCLLERNNPNDINAIAVVDHNKRIVGHIPVGLCTVLTQLIHRFSGNILINW